VNNRQGLCGRYSTWGIIKLGIERMVRGFIGFSSMWLTMTGLFVMLIGGIDSAWGRVASPTCNKALKGAFEASEKGKWQDAFKKVSAQQCPLSTKLLQWAYYQDNRTKASFENITDFVIKNPSWPSGKLLAENAENSLSAKTPDTLILSWFQNRNPKTARGGVYLAEALLRAGRAGEAVTIIKSTWRDMNFGSAGEEKAFYLKHKSHLNPQDHIARLDRHLREDNEYLVKRMLPRVDIGHRLLAKARLALRKKRGGVDLLIAKIPFKLMQKAGLVYERVRWRRQKSSTHYDNGAWELLSGLNGNTEYSSQLWRERAILARRAIERKHFQRAYDLVKGHGFSAGVVFAEGEWLAGWLSLRFLNKPERALKHFERLHANVKTPLSRSRGAYWSGRAEEALGHSKKAKEWYTAASKYQTTYYGQLALERLNKPKSVKLFKAPRYTNGDKQSFEKKELARVAMLLKEVGQDGWIDEFLMQLALRAKSSKEMDLAISFAKNVDPRHIVIVARVVALKEVVLHPHAYPTHSLNYPKNENLEPALVWALIHRESGFDPGLTSVAGAQGMMQLMPSTANRIAKKKGLRVRKGDLLKNPDLNMRLGCSVIAELLKAYDGSYPLALAAYNAGPEPVNEWIKDFGDPRKPDVDEIDWIELISYFETRDYVQRVLELVHIYRNKDETLLSKAF